MDEFTGLRINYSKGCFASDAGNAVAAIGYLTKSENTESGSFSYYHLDNTKRLTIELSKQKEWESAKRFCIKAIRNFRKREDDKKIGKLESCEMLGELAYIQWANGKPEKACGAMYGYVRGLIKDYDVNTPRYREAFNKAGHGLGWFVLL